MFEFLLSIRVYFLAVKVGRMPRRCAATPVIALARAIVVTIRLDCLIVILVVTGEENLLVM